MLNFWGKIRIHFALLCIGACISSSCDAGVLKWFHLVPPNVITLEKAAQMSECESSLLRDLSRVHVEDSGSTSLLGRKILRQAQAQYSKIKSNAMYNPEAFHSSLPLLENAKRVMEHLETRFQRNEESIDDLFQLGWQRVLLFEKTYIFQPPAKLSTIFDRYYSHVEGLVASKRIEESNTILPALVLEKGTKSNPEFLLVRPGLDPFPVKGTWRLTNGGEMPFELFVEALANGKFPTNITMLNHEIGHLLDFMDPMRMRDIRSWAKFYLENKHLYNVRYSFPQINSTKSKENSRFWRTFIALEFLDLPDLKQAHRIRRLYPKKVRFLKFKNLGTVKKALKPLSSDELYENVQRFNSKIRNFLIRKGGGMKDFATIDLSSTQRGNPRTLRNLARMEGSRRAKNLNNVFFETLSGRIRELDYLLSLRGNGDAVLNESIGFFSASAMPFTEKASLRHFDRRLEIYTKDRFARLITALDKALELQITPQQYFTLAVYGENYEGNKLSQWVESFVDPADQFYYAFVYTGKARKD